MIYTQVFEKKFIESYIIDKVGNDLKSKMIKEHLLIISQSIISIYRPTCVIFKKGMSLTLISMLFNRIDKLKDLFYRLAG